LGWIFEEKYDGWRMVAYKREDQMQLTRRPGRDLRESSRCRRGETGSRRCSRAQDLVVRWRIG
jgi:hypothetical protein